MALMSTCN